MRYRGVSAGLSSFEAQSEKNGPFLGCGFGNKGAKSPPPPKAALVDSRFDVDYDFAIKHDPIQADG